MLSYYLCDTEETGLMVGHHEIIEISVINATNLTQLTRIIRADKPENASLDALRITNKTFNDLKKGCSKQKAIEDFEEFINQDGLTPAHRCLVGHNIISFDRRFLIHLWESFNKEFPFHLYLDTIHLMRAYAKKLQLIKPKLNLTASCEIMKIANLNTDWHSAKGDVQNTFFLWQKLMAEVDYLQHIKTMPHYLNKKENEDADQSEY